MNQKNAYKKAGEEIRTLDFQLGKSKSANRKPFQINNLRHKPFDVKGLFELQL